MEIFFRNSLEISIMASFLIVAVLLIRLCFKKASASFRCFLWILVGIRLLVPVSIRSPFGMVPDVDLSVEQELLQDGVISGNGEGQEILAGTGADSVIGADDFGHGTNTGSIQENVAGSENDPSAEQENLSGSGSVQEGSRQSFETMQALGIDDNATKGTSIDWQIATAIWLAGSCLMLAYMLVSFLRLRKSLREAIPAYVSCEAEPVKVYRHESVDSPFLLGVFSPKIYVPMKMAGKDLQFVLAHERMHLRRRDHLWKPLSFIVLALYWFHPLVWVAYLLSGRDMEFACDERVLRENPKLDRAAYAEALLTCAVKKSTIAVCPVAFGEVDVKKRVTNVLNYKKPGLWIILVCALLGVIVLLCFMTVAEDKESLPAESVLTMEGLLEITDNGRLENLIEEQGMDLFLQYENMVQSPISAGAVSATYTCDLEYWDKQYQMQLYYSIGKNGGSDTVSTIYISYPDSGEKCAIYTVRNNIETVDLQEFVDYIDRAYYSLDKYITYQLPDGYNFTLGEFEISIGDEGTLYNGCLLAGDLEMLIQNGINADWAAAPGGIGTFTDWNRVNFENGEPVSITYSGNHRGTDEDSFEKVEGCFTSALLAEVSFDLFTAATWEQYKTEHPEDTTARAQSSIWFVLICDENMDVGYVVFLNEAYFTKEEAIAFAQSIRPIR